MINIYTNKENYQYDLHALMKSFYPEHDVRVYAETERNEHQDSDSHVTVHLFDNGMNVVLDIEGRKEYVHTYKNDTDVTKKECKLSIYQDLCDYGKDASVGEPHGHPSHKACHGNAGGRKG